MEEEEYYKNKKVENLAIFDAFNEEIGKLIEAKYGAEFAGTVKEEIRKEFEMIYAELPYIGGDYNNLTFNLISAAGDLAVYLVLKMHEKPLKEIGEMCYKVCEKMYKMNPELAPKTRPEFIPYIKRAAKESEEKKYPDDWVYSFVESNDEFDYGLDFTECGIIKLFNKFDADEFVPYLCIMDKIMSEASDAGLQRTETLAEGGNKCDFRYKAGGDTKIKSTVLKETNV